MLKFSLGITQILGWLGVIIGVLMIQHAPIAPFIAIFIACLTHGLCGLLMLWHDELMANKNQREGNADNAWKDKVAKSRQTPTEMPPDKPTRKPKFTDTVTPTETRRPLTEKDIERLEAEAKAKGLKF